MRSLLITTLLLLPQLTSAAFIEVEVTPTGNANEYKVEPFVVMEEDVSIATIDFGILAGGLTFTEITAEGGFIECFGFPCSNALFQSRTLASFTASILVGVPVDTGQRLSVGFATLLASEPFTLTISDGIPFEILATNGSIRSPNQNPGDILFVLPEPSGVLLMVGVLGLVRRRFRR